MQLKTIPSLLLLLLFTHCRVLFWKDKNSYLPGSWQNNDHFIEVRMDYQTKLPWYPLSQNMLSRSYRSTFLKYSRDLSKPAKELISLPGWVMNESVYAHQNRILFLRGLSNTPGSMDRREIVLLSDSQPVTLFDKKQLRANSSKPKTYLISYLPDRKLTKLVVFHTEVEKTPRPGTVYADLLYLNDTGHIQTTRQAKFPFAHAPGPPAATWSKNQDILYIRSATTIWQWPKKGKLQPAKSFPACFSYRGDVRIAHDGTVFIRQPQSKSIQLKKEQVDFRPVATKMIRDVDQIDKNCSN